MGLARSYCFHSFFQYTAMQHTLQSIYRCQNLQSARDAPANHPCGAVAAAQLYARCDAYQVPEPWRGDLAGAPLLFVSSNPSIDPTDDSPWNIDSDAEITAYFHKGFPDTFPRIVRPRVGTSSLVRFWRTLSHLANDLFPATVKVSPGKHFALTELVHCKSRGEAGVRKALQTCVSLHLEPILQTSRAAVICVIGAHARAHFARQKVVPDAEAPVHIYIDHPNARGAGRKRKPTPDERDKACRAIRDHLQRRPYEQPRKPQRPSS